MYLHIVDLGLNSLQQLQIIESFFSVMSSWVGLQPGGQEAGLCSHGSVNGMVCKNVLLNHSANEGQC